MSGRRASMRRRGRPRAVRAANKGAGHGGLPVRFPGRRLPAALPRADAKAHAGVGHLDRRAVQARAVQGRRSARAGRQAGEGQEEDRGGRPVRGGEGPGRRVPPGHGGEPRRRHGARARVPHPGGGRNRRGPPDPQDVSPAAPLPGLVDHLFRHEAGRLAAALVRVLGPANLDLAEDVVQETLCHALEVWKMGRVPDNPAAWLRASARNRALDLLRRQRIRIRLAPEVAQLHGELAPAVDAVFTEDALRVEQLRMMFACCDARLQPAVQVALVLKLLCGFGVDEVAQAFLASPAAIEKRLARGKTALRRAGALADLSDPQLARRLEAVLDALYLLFNEGYHGAHPELAVRAELCAEAIRLVRLLAQDPSAWDRALAAEGARWLSRAVSEPPTALLLEAAIAAEHCFAPTFAATDWRAIALAQVDGPERGLEELQALPGRDRLGRYPFYFAALGELHLRAGHAREAAEEFRRALRLARSPAERQHFQRKLASATERTRMRGPGAVRTLRR